MRQNAIKRTIISFALAFAISLATIYIQNNNDNRVEAFNLEAKVFPESMYFMQE